MPRPKKIPKKDFMDDAHTLMHPIRLQLVELLGVEGEHYIKELAKALGEDRRLVSHHLDVLEDYGFVTSRYEISEKPESVGRGLRIYQVTSKVFEVRAELKMML
jgi:DNA-binding transcriptional ArsR family regulator